MKSKVIEYIKENLPKTIIYNAKDIPFPYNSPSTQLYVDFFYWDLYFINKALLMCDMDEQAENNIKDMMYFVNKQGYVPNSNSGDMQYRTQPPVFPLAVYDLYKYRKDKKVIEDYIDAVIKEHNFFQERRMTKIGLNAYMCDDETNTYDIIVSHYFSCGHRIGVKTDDEKERYQIGREIIAVAESGLDFNARFKTESSAMAASEFAHVDLNSWLYIDEIKIAEMLKVVSRDKEAKAFLDLASARKELMNKYFFDEKQGIYVDYRLTTGHHSHVVTAASLYPHAFGISKDKDSCLKVLKMLELECGVSTAAYRGEDEFYFQWDYPVMWGETTYIVYLALKNVGADMDASRIAKKYMNTIEKQFEKTGKLWEKYDARNGEIMNVEYDAPEFLGWTAFAYLYFAFLEK